MQSNQSYGWFRDQHGTLAGYNAIPQSLSSEQKLPCLGNQHTGEITFLKCFTTSGFLGISVIGHFYPN